MSTCLDDLNATLADIATALDAALPDTGWLSWSAPVVSQPGTISIDEIRLADYRVQGGMLDARLNLLFDGAGTGSNNIILAGLPVQPANNDQGQVLGLGFLNFAGTSYGAIAVPDGSDGVLFIFAGSGGVIGTNPNVALAAGDSLYLSLRYRVEVA